MSLNSFSMLGPAKENNLGDFLPKLGEQKAPAIDSNKDFLATLEQALSSGKNYTSSPDQTDARQDTDQVVNKSVSSDNKPEQVAQTADKPQKQNGTKKAQLRKAPDAEALLQAAVSLNKQEKAHVASKGDATKTLEGQAVSVALATSSANPSKSELQSKLGQVNSKKESQSAQSESPVTQSLISSLVGKTDKNATAQIEASETKKTGLSANHNQQAKASVLASSKNAADSNVPKLALEQAMATVRNLAQEQGIASAVAQNSEAKPGKPKLGLVDDKNLSAKSSKKVNEKGVTAEAQLARYDRSSTQRIQKERTADIKRSIEVTDLRGQNVKPQTVLETLLSDAQKQSGIAAGFITAVSPSSRSDEGRASLEAKLMNNAVFLPTGERSINIPVSLNTSNGSFGQSLRDWLRERGGQDILSQAKIMFKGGNVGEIKLILNPENLGQVRINLELKDGHIAGTILVENKEVQAAFDEELANLKQAFADGGFDANNLQVAVGSHGDHNFGQSSSQGQRSQHQLDYAHRKLEEQVTVLSSVEYGNSQVNLMA